MIYEVRTYRLTVGSVPKFVEAFGKAYEGRKEISELAAFFYTEIGPLNEVIHIWPYESMEHRADCRAQAMKTDFWPPDVSEFQVHMRSEIFMPWDITPAFPTGNVGPIFEWRSYMIKPHGMGAHIEAWNEQAPARFERSPCIMAMHTDLGELNRFVHIWPYDSLEQRAQVRGQAVKDGIWPPKSKGNPTVEQTNKICLAAPFSPLQ